MSTEPLDFINLRCKPRPDDEKALQPEDAKKHISSIGDGWQLSNDGKTISRTFKFKNYYETMAFVNAAALVAHQQDHHPDMHVSYNTCLLEYSTHSVGGLSINDFICATKTDHMLNI